jgi:UrcA family protein
MKISGCSTIRRFVVTTLVGSFALGLATASIAGDSRDVRSITVKFADLNVSNPQGAAVLYGRIARAAKSVCTPADYSPWPISQMNGCVHKAIADAVTKVNQEALYTVYNQHNKPPLPARLLSQTR